MLQKPSIRLLVLLLVASFVLSLAAVPTTRSLKSDEEDLLVQKSPGTVGLRDEEELFNVGKEEGFIEGRMDIESTDYPGPGANNHHDPRTPGRA